MINVITKKSSKSEVMEKFIGSSSVMQCNESTNLFAFEFGSNEGCYMTIDGFVFRSHLEGDEAMKRFRDAISLYLTIQN